MNYGLEITWTSTIKWHTLHVLYYDYIIFNGNYLYQISECVITIPINHIVYPEKFLLDISD